MPEWANARLITHHLTMVSLALATMAASSSSVISMARLNWVVSVVLKVAGRPWIVYVRSGVLRGHCSLPVLQAGSLSCSQPPVPVVARTGDWLPYTFQTTTLRRLFNAPPLVPNYLSPMSAAQARRSDLIQARPLMRWLMLPPGIPPVARNTLAVAMTVTHVGHSDVALPRQPR